MKKTAVAWSWIVGIFIFQVVTAQKLDVQALDKIRHEGLESSQVEKIAHQLVDVAGSRLTNSPGFHRAADWSIQQLTEWGLVNARLDEWGEFGYGWQFEKSYLAMTKPYYMPFIGLDRKYRWINRGRSSGRRVKSRWRYTEVCGQITG